VAIREKSLKVISKTDLLSVEDKEHQRKKKKELSPQGEGFHWKRALACYQSARKLGPCQISGPRID
jgi:hypothetical protein